MSVAPRTNVRAARQSRTTGGVAATVETMMLAERTKWAMHIHDGLTQSVTSAVLELQSLRQRLEADPDQALAALRVIEDAIRTDLREIREILLELEQGKLKAEPPLATFVHEIVERWRLPARVSVEGDLASIPGFVQDVAHGIIAEALANAAKHSGSPIVLVRLRARADELRVEVEDRGRGMALIGDEDPHFGIRMMRARAEEIHGHLEIESTPGRGTRVVARLPVGEARES